uniref:Uncharacterized protein n=1 Tax=Glossina austeni TaxID=7395 RepID=A0A1A9UGA2_GLOAU
MRGAIKYCLFISCYGQRWKSFVKQNCSAFTAFTLIAKELGIVITLHVQLRQLRQLRGRSKDVQSPMDDETTTLEAEKEAQPSFAMQIANVAIITEAGCAPVVIAEGANELSLFPKHDCENGQIVDMKSKYLPVVEWKQQVLDYQSCDEIQINNFNKNKECTHTVARNSSGQVELRTSLDNNKTKVLTKILFQQN